MRKWNNRKKKVALENQKMLLVKLNKSIIGIHPKHKACIKTLGLRRINHVVEVVDTDSLRGVINQVSYLVSVEEM